MHRREFLAGTAAVLASATIPLPVAAAPTYGHILPDIMRCGSVVRTARENTYTLYYWHMMRWDLRAQRMEFARSDSPAYRAWLASDPYYAAQDVPPHIQFGGAVVAGKGDPHFHSRWKAGVIADLRSNAIY